MRVIGVIDLLRGRAVHARAGNREVYQPIRTVAGTAIESGDAEAVARIYRERFGLAELYAADLDAIAGGPPQVDIVRSIATVGALWLDAGVSSPEGARHALALGAGRVIVGLEPLQSWEHLAAICADVGGSRVAFGLDLRDGRPLSTFVPPDTVPTVTAGRAVDCGVESIVAIDLARVGTGGGPDLELIARVREAAPHVMLLAGGGVRDADDLARLADAGCDGALVATALHDGSLSR